MNVSINIDCTPEEARRFMGLPDLSAVHAVYVDKMMSVVQDGISPADVERMTRAWVPFTESSFDAWRKIFQAATGERGS